jgi:DNA-binding transcriptional ArsR family regulator
VPRQHPSPLPDPKAAGLFRLLGDPARLRLLLLLADRGEVCAGDLAVAAGQSPSAGHARLGLLRRGGVLTSQRQGQRVYYRLSSPLVAGLLLRVDGD